MTFLNKSRVEIMADILQRAVTGAKKTWLLYSANLSYSQHQKYISTLVELGLLSKMNGLYTTTKKGMDFITSYQTLTSLLGETFSMTAEAKRELAKRSRDVLKVRYPSPETTMLKLKFLTPLMVEGTFSLQVTART